MPGDEPRVNAQWIRSAVDRYERPLIVYAAQIVGDLDRARDVVQETFVRLCSQNQAGIESHLAEWLFTVCRNRALDVKRKDRRLTFVGDGDTDVRVDPMPTPLDAAEERDATTVVLDVLEHLPPNQREVVRLKFQQGLSYQEISEVTGLSVTNVGFLIHTGLKTIRQRLADRESGKAGKPPPRRTRRSTADAPALGKLGALGIEGL